MKTNLKILIAIGLLSGASICGAAQVSAQPVGFSFRIGDVGVAYNDGYYDRAHRFHAWRGQERDWYRSHYENNFRAYGHDRDHDGIPDRMDRDRDNDGVPNNRDRSPNNPYRR